jgi:hypothetical protein
MLDLFDTWHILLEHAADRGSYESVLKEAESLFRKWQLLSQSHSSSSHSYDASLDNSELLALRQQLTTKMTALESMGATLTASIQPKPFTDVFDMESHFRQHRPILPVFDGDVSLSSGGSNPNLVGATTPRSAQPKMPPAAGAAATSSTSPMAKRPPAKVVVAAAPKRRKAADNAGGAALRDQVARRAKRKQSVLVARGGAVTMRKARFHIVVDVSEVHIYLGQEATLSLALYSLAEDRMVAEEISFPLPTAMQAVAPGKARVIFTDVSIASIEDLHLVCRIVRIGKLKYDYAKAQQLAATATGMLGSSPSSVAAATVTVSSTLPSASSASGISSSDVRRPFAVAALALSDAVEVEDSKATKSAVHLFAPADEAEFPRSHQYIINEDRDHPLTLIKAKGLVLVRFLIHDFPVPTCSK